MLLPIRENAFDRDQLGARSSRRVTPHCTGQRQRIDEVDGDVPAELQVRPGKPGNGFIPKAADVDVAANERSLNLVDAQVDATQWGNDAPSQGRLAHARQTRENQQERWATHEASLSTAGPCGADGAIRLGIHARAAYSFRGWPRLRAAAGHPPASRARSTAGRPRLG